MGRPGGGGHSIGGRSISSRPSSRSGSGHRVGGGPSSRPRGSQGSYSGGYSGGHSGRSGGGGYYRSAPPPRPPRTSVYGGGSRRYRSGGSTGGCSGMSVTVILVVVVLIIVFAVLLSGGALRRNNSASVPNSTYNREKLDAGNGFINKCIVDELGWFKNESKTESRLKKFYEKTGVQPYIILLKYNPALTSDALKEAYAEQLYDKYIDNEATFLYIYFAEQYENDASEPGFMYCVNGRQATSVMDSEAVEIFWAYVDRYWYSDLSTDDMFVKIFDSTADRIMTKTTTKNDVLKYVLIACAAGIVVFGVIQVVKLKHKRAKEEAEETERILNTPMESLVEKELQETAKKYDEQAK